MNPACMMETLLAMKRAGADGILTYFALGCGGTAGQRLNLVAPRL